MALSHNTKRT